MFTVDDVIAAYRATGLKPVQGEFFAVKDGTMCGCGLTTLYFNQTQQTPTPELAEELSMFDGRPTINRGVMRWAQMTYGDAFMQGFLRGFDNAPMDLDFADEANKIACAEGYATGYQCWIRAMYEFEP